MRQLFALANDFKEGDLAVGGTRDDRLRHDARRTLLVHHRSATSDARSSSTTGSARRSIAARDRSADGELDPLSIARIKSTLLSPGGSAWARRHRTRWRAKSSPPSPR